MIFNPGKSHLLWVVPNPLCPLDYDGLVTYLGQVIGPFAPNLTIANELILLPAKGVVPVFFAASRCHAESDPSAAEVAVIGSAQVQNGYQFDPIWIYFDKASAGATGDRLYFRMTRVVAHGFGHAFGADHDPRPNNVMYKDLVDTPYTCGSASELGTAAFFWNRYLS